MGTKYVCPNRCSADLAGNPIQPTVPLDTPICMIVGEAPGHNEDKQQRFFVGKAGQELTNYLDRADIPRSRCYLTNILKCSPPGDRDPRAEEVRCCTAILQQELATVRPRFIVAVGRFAAQWFLGDVNMEMVHGIPYHITTPLDAIVIPVYHPAAGLHESTAMSNIMADFLAVKAAMTGKIKPRELGQFATPPPFHVLEPGEDPTPYMTNLVGLDTETSDEHDTPYCLQFSSGEQGHVIMADNTDSLLMFAIAAADPKRLFIIHNSLFDCKVLRSMGIECANIVDTMIMAYLLQTEPQGLKPLTFRHLGVKMDEYDDIVGPRTQEMGLEYLIQASLTDWGKVDPVVEVKAGKAKVKQPQPINQKINRIINDLAAGKEVDILDRWHKTPSNYGRSAVEAVLGRMRKAYLKDVDYSTAMQYAATDPWATYHIYPVLKKKVEALGLGEVLARDIGTILMVDRMQQTGFPVHIPHFHLLGNEFGGEMEALDQEIRAMVGDVHAGSDPQVLDLMGRLGVVQIKYKLDAKGKMVPIRKKMTDAAALELVKDRHPVIPKILRYRELKKLVDSYVTTLTAKTDANNRVHTTLRVTKVVTGRLSSSNPNLMGIPTRTKDGKKIRGGFQAPPGYVILSNDYAQVEMRVIAHISQDPNMMEVFLTGADLHSYTAAGMFRIPIDAVDEMKHRYPAKRVGFGILNLISAQKLLKMFMVEGITEWTEASVQQLINDWFRLYAKIAAYVRERKAEARRTGMVRDMFGRIRLVPEVMSVHKAIVEAGERQAVNAPIQMGAQGIIKEAMKQLGPVCRDIGYDIVDPLLQIHDDLIFLVKESELGWVQPLIKDTMENCIQLSVPLHVDSKAGYRWDKLEK